MFTSFLSITPTKLFPQLGLTAQPTIIDVRIDEDYTNSLIFTSKRHDFREVELWGAQYIGQKCVIVCHKGLKLSQGVAAHLRLLGIAAISMEGGFVGWLEAKLPVMPAHDNALWVTRERPKVDRIACPWLISRFINPDAKFLYVRASDVLGVAEKFRAIPYDIEGVHYTHRGENCSFDTLIEEFNLDIPALKKLALIVRGADTDRLDLTPQSEGLLAYSLGLSHQYDDDLAQLKAGMGFYDALYHFCLKDTGEKHNWFPAKVTK